MRLDVRGEYPPNWSTIAQAVKDAAGWRCIRCHHPHETISARVACDERCSHSRTGKLRGLTVHHLDGDKGNVHWWNLLALCQACHLSVQARVIPERPWLFDHTPWFVPYVCGFYAAHYAGIDITRTVAERHAGLWLAIGQPWRAEMSEMRA